MEDLVNKILSENTLLVAEKDKAISFDTDIEGKRFLNKEVSQLYNKKLKITDEQLIHIVVNSQIIITKMSKLKKCGWDISALNEQLIDGVGHFKNRLAETHEPKDSRSSILTSTLPSFNSKSLRQKYPPHIKTLDGHYVRSKAEMLIDNFLYINGIVHAYERKLPIEEIAFCDFYIPSGKDRPHAVYIEFWGLENEEKYLARKKIKGEIYKKYNFPLIEIVDDEINNLEEILTQKLIQYKIKVY